METLGPMVSNNTPVQKTRQADNYPASFVMYRGSCRASLPESRGLETQTLYHNTLALSAPRTKIANLRHCSKQIAGGGACSCLVPMHLQCGKSRPYPYSLFPDLVLTASTNRSSMASAYL